MGARSQTRGGKQTRAVSWQLAASVTLVAACGGGESADAGFIDVGTSSDAAVVDAARRDARPARDAHAVVDASEVDIDAFVADGDGSVDTDAGDVDGGDVDGGAIDVDGSVVIDSDAGTGSSADAATSVDAAGGSIDAATASDAFVGDDAFVAASDGGATTVLGTCAAPRNVTLTLGTVVVTGSTSGGPPGMLRTSCGGNNGMPQTPQEVLRMTVPGTGSYRLTFSTVRPGTAANFDTVLEARVGDCTTTPPVGNGQCNDDVGSGEYRSTGDMLVTGGSTVYVIVASWNGPPIGMNVASGPYELALSLTSSAAPTLRSVVASRRTNGTTTSIVVSGSDSDADASRADIEVLDMNGVVIPPNPSQPSVLSFSSAIGGSVGTDVVLDATALTNTAARSVRVVLRDAQGNSSAPVTTSITRYGAQGDTCSAMFPCDAGFACGATSTCQPMPTLEALCSAAPSITLVAPTGSTATTTSRMTTYPTTASVTTATCGGNGPELAYLVTVPALSGPADLVASTVNAGTPGNRVLDTVVYIRATCTATDALVCNDDVETAVDYRSTTPLLNASPGTYAVFVDSFSNSAAGAVVQADFRLRPVLGTAATCDPTGVNNRCAAAACTALGVCP